MTLKNPPSSPTGTKGIKRPKKKSNDILDSLSKRLRKPFTKKGRIEQAEMIRRVRMQDAREWSMKSGSGKIPEWTEINWSPDRAPIMFARAWWKLRAVPTRVRTKTLKSGKKRYYLDIYNHTARTTVRKKRK